MKTCSDCQTEKEETEFYVTRHRYKEKVYKYLSTRCKPCHRRDSRARMAKDPERKEPREGKGTGKQMAGQTCSQAESLQETILQEKTSRGPNIPHRGNLTE